MLCDVKRTKNEIVQWIRNYFARNGQTCFAVVGISGGKDSSVVAALCVEALGKDRVMGVLMPNGVQDDIECSYQLVKHLGIPHKVVNIAEPFNAMVAQLNEALPVSRQTIVNLPARLRMATLYAVAQSLPYGGRVANTCNRSEDYVGYATKFGDAAGDFSPLSHLMVHEVKQLGYELGLPKNLIEKVPTDGLCGSTDEDNLGFTYETLDNFIMTGNCEDPEIRAKIVDLHDRNIHKLRPMPAYGDPYTSYV